MTMPFDPVALRTLAVVVEDGSFEAAAARLHVTPSAVSQRVKAIEERVGQVLVRRSRPCVATDAGRVLVRLAGQLEVLEHEARAALGLGGASGQADRTRLTVAVNADSLSTWFPRALAGLPPDVVLDLRRADQEWSADLLRDGTAMAAVTADARPVQGCRAVPLGAMRYLAVAAPDAWQAWSATGLDRAPQVAFDRHDTLQQRFLQATDGPGAVPAPVHHVPSQEAFVAVVAAGLGWGMVPEVAARDLLAARVLVEVRPGSHLDVPLHWQHWSLRTAALDDLTGRVVAAARSELRPTEPARRPVGGGRAPTF